MDTIKINHTLRAGRGAGRFHHHTRPHKGPPIKLSNFHLPWIGKVPGSMRRWSGTSSVCSSRPRCDHECGDTGGGDTGPKIVSRTIGAKRAGAGLEAQRKTTTLLTSEATSVSERTCRFLSLHLAAALALLWLWPPCGCSISVAAPQCYLLTTAPLQKQRPRPWQQQTWRHGSSACRLRAPKPLGSSAPSS